MRTHCRPGFRDSAAAPAAFDPTTISGLKLYYSALRENGLVDGDEVLTLHDYSGNGLDATSPSGQAYIFKTGVANGNNALRGATDAEALGRGTEVYGDLSGFQAFTMFVVAKTDWANDTVNLIRFTTLTADMVTGQLIFKNGDTSISTGLNVLTGTGWHVLEFYRSGITQEIVVDGATLVALNTATGPADTAQTNTLGVMARSASSAANALNGDWVSWMCYGRALNLTERQQLRTGLGALVGLTL